MRTYTAGAGKAEIRLPQGFLPAEGFGVQVDALYARALWLESGQSALLVSLELTSLPDAEGEALAALLAEEAGIPRTQLWLCVTHTFSAPHLMPEALLQSEAEREKREALRRAIAEAALVAAAQAKREKREAMLRLGRAFCDVNVNRDVETPEGWWLGSNGAGPSDKAVTALCFNALDGTPIATLFHYAVQSSILDGAVLEENGKAVSADLAGRASAYVEQQRGGIACFLMGAAGDQAPRKKARIDAEDVGSQGLSYVEELGDTLGRAVLEASESAQPQSHPSISFEQAEVVCQGQKIPPSIRDLHPTRAYAYQPDGQRTVELSLLQIGPTALLGTKAELDCRTATELMETAKPRMLLVCCMVNGGAKYMADARSYERYTYEAMNSFYAKGSAERLAEKAGKLLRALGNRDEED